jgi:glycosyl transferase family 25
MNIQTYIINIPTRRDRYDHIVEEVKKLPIIQYEVIEAIVDGAKGCSQSHLKCIRLAKDNQLPYVLILEDDAIFTENCLETLEQALAEIEQIDWSMLYLGANLNSPAYRVSEGLLKLTGAWCTHAYIVHSNFYDTILSLPHGREIDVCYTELMQHSNVYMVNPIVSYQLPSHSDIQNGFREYNEAMNVNFLRYIQ